MWTGAYLPGQAVDGHIYYIGMCVFHERQCDICRRRAYSQGFAKAVHMSYGRQYFLLFFLLFPLCRGEASLLVTAKYGYFRD